MKEPLALRWIRAQGLGRLVPWHFVDDEARVAGLRAEYRVEVSGGSQPEGDILPFAVRQDRDDVAAFVVEAGVVTEAVVIVHLTWKQGPELPGWPSVQRFRDFWSWLKVAIDDTAEWASEEELADVGDG
jgi:hypothetical protein